MASYNHFSNDNVALVGSRDIGVFKNGEKIGRIPLGSLRQPNRERRIYSFGLISDLEIGESGADAKFRSALTYLGNNEDIEFVTICGDMVKAVREGESQTIKKPWFQSYQAIVLECANGKEIFAIGGNHEQWMFDVTAGYMKDYVGNQSVWNTKEFGNDIFLFLGTYQYIKNNNDGDFQKFLRKDVRAIEEVLNANRNKRCFVFHHTPFVNDAEYNIFQEGYEKCALPRSLLQHYKNITVFSGHTHSQFEKHFGDKSANVNRNYGFRSVHVPSLGDYCEGYVVDVYEDGIHLRGLNFETGFIPVASYWIDTSLVDVSEGYTYKGV